MICACVRRKLRAWQRVWNCFVNKNRKRLFFPVWNIWPKNYYVILLKLLISIIIEYMVIFFVSANIRRSELLQIFVWINTVTLIIFSILFDIIIHIRPRRFSSSMICKQSMIFFTDNSLVSFVIAWNKSSWNRISTYLSGNAFYWEIKFTFSRTYQIVLVIPEASCVCTQKFS